MKEGTIFFDVIGEPIDFFWTSEKDLNQKKIVIKAKKCK